MPRKQLIYMTHYVGEKQLMEEKLDVGKTQNINIG